MKQQPRGFTPPDVKYWLAGYTGRKATDFPKICELLDAVLVDIRFSAKSMRPQWEKKALERLLGTTYYHVQDLGNVNFKGGDIRIRDLGVGLRILENMHTNCILLCACKDGEICHRKVIGDRLRERGHDVAEVDWSIIEENPQLSLL